MAAVVSTSPVAGGGWGSGAVNSGGEEHLQIEGRLTEDDADRIAAAIRAARKVAEHPVGDFSLDLLGRDTSTGEAVIVENQLEQSDHNHLGQILTYAAGTDPTTIVWLATSFREEHRAAVDWLNSRTDDRTRFFAVQIALVRIGESAPAPAFRLIAQPNDWEKVARASSATNGRGVREGASPPLRQPIGGDMTRPGGLTPRGQLAARARRS